MAYREEKIEQFNQALQTLEELMGQEATIVVRDAAIQRFEYTVESFWKTLKVYLREKEGVDAPTPKAAIREGGSAHILSPDEVVLALAMIDDRNQTSHLYNRMLAGALYEKLPNYAGFLRKVCDRLKE